MKTPALKTTVKNKNELILIVDRENAIGEELAKEFSKDFVVVFVSSVPPLKNKGKIIHIPFNKRIPKIPQYDYAKLFIIDDGYKVTRESLYSFMQKAKELRSDFYFITSIRSPQQLKQLEELTLFYQRVKILFFGDLFDKDYIFSKNVPISKFIIQARTNGRLLVAGNGLDLNYPVSLKDTIKLIIKASYLNINEKYILLFPPHPITEISLANTFQKINPLIKVDFTKEKDGNRLIIPKGGLYAISKYDIRERLSELDFKNNSVEKQSIEVKSPRQKHNVANMFIFAILLLLSCIFLFFLPLIITTSYVGLGSWQFNKGIYYAEKGDYSLALKKTKNANSFFKLANNSNNLLNHQLNLIGVSNRAQDLNKKIVFYVQGTDALINVFEGLGHLNNVYFDNDANSKKEFEKFIKYFIKANVALQELKTEGENLAFFNQNLNDIDNLMALITSTSEALPDVLGFNGTKNYLLIVLNENILRPGGGSVSFTQEISLNNGKIVSSQPISASRLDEEIINKTISSSEIQKYLNKEDLRFSDVLNSPDTFVNSINALELYESYSDKAFDGVIVVDLNFLQSLNSFNKNSDVISKEGNILDLEDNNDLDLKKVNESVITFFKKIKLNNDKNKYFLSLMFLNGLSESVAGKHFLINLKADDLRNNFYINNLTGSIVDNREKNKNVINDFFGLSESSMGTNMVNLNISRSVIKKVIINQDKTISSTVTISYKNNSALNSNTTSYNNFMRLILPNGIALREISIGGKKQNVTIRNAINASVKGTNTSDDLEVIEERLLDKTIISFYISVDPESLKTVNVDYSTPFILNDSGVTKYSVLVYKQPGIISYPFNLSFTLPIDFTINPKNLISQDIYKDSEFRFIISKLFK